MGDLLLSLALGIGLILAANLLLLRFGSLNAARSAVLVALLSAGVYLAIAVADWPGADVLAMHLAVYSITSYACSVFLGQKMREKNRRQPWHWGPMVIVGFFVFLVILFSLFILVAEWGLPPMLISKVLPHHSAQVSSIFPGVISHDFQQKEALYNEYLEQLRRQRERGWQVHKGWLQQPVTGQPAMFRVVAKTGGGEPLRGAEVTGQFLRPSDSRLDVAFSMREIEPGTYEAAVNLPAAGTWDLVLQLRKGEDLHEIRAATAVQSP
jgi:nitrogen fixation protein FixH